MMCELVVAGAACTEEETRCRLSLVQEAAARSRLQVAMLGAITDRSNGTGARCAPGALYNRGCWHIEEECALPASTRFEAWRGA